ncbi:unnamed protein product [Rangifer tarandus platyrhynchus]|uniref:Uncharacterized protein n=1 Tax=Rangifer tarandus platyrhynchus TaxID=3082113 RepID=A0ABN9A164_RANTA|nr:unnamed protein product [Rangifer tarandus platyrhynchus]
MFVLWSTAELPELEGSTVLSSVPGVSAPRDPLDVAAPEVTVTPGLTSKPSPPGDPRIITGAGTIPFPVFPTRPVTAQAALPVRSPPPAGRQPSEQALPLPCVLGINKALRP